jgi:hypothetical protein
MNPKITIKNMELLNNTLLLLLNNSSAVLINPFLRGEGSILAILNNKDANSILENLLIRREKRILMQKKVKITMEITLICFSESGFTFILY